MGKRCVVCAVLSVAVSLALGFDAPSAPPAKLTVVQVIDKNVAARGGLQAWRAVQTLSLSGKMDAGGNQRSTLPVRVTHTGPGMPGPRPLEQVQLPFVLDMKRPRKMRLEIQFHGQTAVQVYDGANGWNFVHSLTDTK